MIIHVSIRMQIDDRADPESLTDRLMDFLCEDPDDLFPEIQVVEALDWRKP